MRFIPHTPDDVREMLQAIGVRETEDLWANVPQAVRVGARIDLPPGLSEREVVEELGALAALNTGTDYVSFLGAGAYPHFIPAVVDQILRRDEFYSAYTPYQPEVSQGTLQATFEFQSLVAMLFDLEVANASMYDGASATAEAVLMALRIQPKRRRVLVARSLHPEYRQVTRTYLQGAKDIELIEVPFGADGRVDLAFIGENVNEDTAAVVLGYPNFFGIVEDPGAVQTLIGASGALLVTVTQEPLALAAIKPPGAWGVQIAVGEGQSFGIPLSYGGPGVGLFATQMRYVRSMPGRLVGEAVDAQGRRGYVLTLATREQHIRRERATSNICTNHGLTALAATVYLCLLGKHGLRRLAMANLERAHATCARLCASGLWEPRFDGPFFNELALRSRDARGALERAEKAGVLAGVALGRWYPELDDTILLAVTELHPERALARLAEALG